MKFFFDNHLPPSLARALHLLSFDEGHSVEHLRDKFLPSITDVDWIKALGIEGGWIIVTADRKILTSPHEFAAWKEANLTTFFLDRGWGSMQRWDIIWKIAQRWPKIMEMSNRYSTGMMFRVQVRSLKIIKSGKIEHHK